MTIFFEKMYLSVFFVFFFLFLQSAVAFGEFVEEEMKPEGVILEEEVENSVDQVGAVDLVVENVEEGNSSFGENDDAESIAGSGQSSFFDKYISGRLQIGSHSTYRHFQKADSGHKGGVYKSGTFLGTIYAVKEKQDFAPTYPYISWYFSKYIGVELAYDHITAETVATTGYNMIDKTDGDIELSGPTFSLLVRYPNETKFTPWIGLGMFLYSASFDPVPDWSYSKRYKGAYNKMTLEDVQGVLLSAGVGWMFYDHWILNASVQYMSVDVDGVYDGYLNGVQYTKQFGHFPLDNISVRVGIGYQF